MIALNHIEIATNNLSDTTDTGDIRQLMKGKVKRKIVRSVSSAIFPCITSVIFPAEKIERSVRKKARSFKRKFKAALWDKGAFERAGKIGVCVGLSALAGLYATESFAVDIEAATKAGVRPLRNTVVWIEPYLLGFAGMAGMYFSEGDLKTKAVKTGIGVGALWAVSSALISWMPNVA